MNKRGFASDNNSGIHPHILAAISEANKGHVHGYGDDIYTHRAIAKFKELFGNDIDVYFVFNGTGANVLSISTLNRPFQSVICPSTAHIMVDECGAPEKISGCKLIPIKTPNGKLTPELIKPHLHGFDFEHHAQPGIISISQVTELGTLYSVSEIKAISELAHQHNMFVHVDGARLANAAVALDLPFRAFTKEAGVDVLSFGGTKNGMMMGEAVVFFNPELAQYAKYIRKQSAQLYSKMRFVSAQFISYFENDLWKTNALHANTMAKLLAEKVKHLGISITQEVEANGVFALLDDSVSEALQQEYFFYPWDENKHEVRWMTAFDTTVDDIEGFCATLEKLLNG
ncbi:MAG TPA: low specificity L-threonine aldolase [Prolixibacteraceae bacterium]|nr:low specificity L-threonine aldolase [Prolixibacteraceae bacterium]